MTFKHHYVLMPPTVTDYIRNRRRCRRNSSRSKHIVNLDTNYLP